MRVENGYNEEAIGIRSGNLYTNSGELFNGPPFSMDDFKLL